MKIILSLVFLVLGACASAPAARKPSSAQRPAGCSSPLGYIFEGQSAIGYLRPFDSNQMPCEQGTLQCTNGAWAGAYIYPSCVRAP